MSKNRGGVALTCQTLSSVWPAAAKLLPHGAPQGQGQLIFDENLFKFENGPQRKASSDLPDGAWPAARSAALWAFCRRQNAPDGRYMKHILTSQLQRETSSDQSVSCFARDHSVEHWSLFSCEVAWPAARSAAQNI